MFVFYEKILRLCLAILRMLARKQAAAVAAAIV